MLQIKNTLGGGKPEGLYAWKKLSAQGGDFIDYVVSDKETAYPDGSEKDGYYYEKVSDVKIASGSFTANGVTELEIYHGLGKIPNKFIIYPVSASADYFTNANGLYIDDSGKHYWTRYNTSGVFSMQPYKSSSTVRQTCTIDENTIKVPTAMASSNTSDLSSYAHYWKGRFGWVAIAI